MNKFEIILSVAVACFSFYGIFLGGCMKNPKHSRNLAVYYTNISNIVVIIYETLLLISNFAFEKLFLFLESGTLRFIMMNMILTTFLVYAFILYPASKKYKATLTDVDKEGSAITFNNLCVHYIAPLGFVLQWLFFADKELPFLAVVYWVAVPLAYYLFIFIRVMLKINVYGKDTPYPYFFIDPLLLGRKRFIINFMLCIAAFFLLGTITYGISRLLSEI